ncbi:phosphoenolpyruvate carboxylase [Bacteriovorax sp. Seq25_V]|uniref:phosphoenolpyruvate carboxylase n=1 Tax=Bacteriovorax sp. Seq25_V TaxID=1201288 RepID=UPI00038A1B3E|nr:phosphoenolpyruvate carboxylase [Bacteriovorax sp. Seq25_V]EQC45420.1 phosphoenolpyruvate carboxylase-like protein [Bacteriovorax sp. Seq25_V]
MQNLPQELKDLVKIIGASLGEEIRNVYGNKIYTLVEKLRVEFKNNLASTSKEKSVHLQESLKKIYKLSDAEAINLCHAYGVYLELVNRAENAYRHHRLASDKRKKELQSSPYAIIYVFTAHPTEARSEKLMKLFNSTEALLIAFLEGIEDTFISELKFHLNLILRSSMASTKKPTVFDEASHIYNIVLDKKILDLQVKMQQRGITVHFRSWVGGDKDGHPFVNHQTMRDSLQLSRDILLRYVSSHYNKHLKLLKQTDLPLKALEKESQKLVKLFASVKEIKKLDGRRIALLKDSFSKYCKLFEKEIKNQSPYLEKIKSIVWLYPTLVLPLEVREDSSLVHEALKDKNFEIYKMLKYLQEISIGERSKWYVRGFILSMCEEASDYQAGLDLVKKALKELYIPVVPLFETQKALSNAHNILNEVFKKNPTLLKHHQNKWHSRFEVMLGYSDSSKESGVFSGKWLIAKAINAIDENLLAKKLTPVFFHGSGGSIARGGGSLKEQIRWWPKSALNIYKVTIQGEMVARTFGDSLILQSQVAKITTELNEIKNQKMDAKFISTMDEMAKLSTAVYKNLFDNDKFVHAIKAATPYLYLDHLKIGSRPSKRQKTTSTELKLRAIPWILCWTQTRGLLPNWFGVGTAWRDIDVSSKKVIKDSYQSSDYLRSFINTLGFSLAKIEIEVFKAYLNEFMDRSHADEVYQIVENELMLAKKFFIEVSGQRDLLFFRPWLGESIQLRSRMIHPINLLQIRALKNKDYQLLRETVTAIACGMMTTG